jgi:spore maturation protein CgeB
VRPHQPSKRVLVIGAHQLPDTMEWHVLDALGNVGCKGFFTATRSGGWSFADRSIRKAANLLLREPERVHERRLARMVSRVSPDLVLVILGSDLSPKTVKLLRQRTKSPIVCWCQDAIINLGRQYLLGAGYDAVFVKDRYMQDIFSRMVTSTQFHYLPEACNPRVHRAVPLSEADRRRYGCDITIAGNLYYYRQEILQQLAAFDVKIWGNRPDWLVSTLDQVHMGREVFGDEKARAVRAARVALNTLHYAEINSLNCRAFELAGCGAFQMITARPVLSEHFVPGVELETFESVGELIEKCRYYVDHADEAASIAERGYQRAQREHTYEARLQVILETVFGRTPNGQT